MGITAPRRLPPLFVVGIAALSLGAVGLGAVAQQPDERAREVAATPEIVVAFPSYAYDFSDDRILTAYASHVFLGRVIEQSGQEGLPTSSPEEVLPQTQFTVEVVVRIKGNLPDKVTVNQSSGIDQRTNQLVLLDGDPLLEKGELILFATAYEPEHGWYTIIGGPFGAKRAKDANDAAALVARFEAAEKEQFLPIPQDAPPPAADDAASGEAGSRKAQRDKDR